MFFQISVLGSSDKFQEVGSGSSIIELKRLIWNIGGQGTLKKAKPCVIFRLNLDLSKLCETLLCVPLAHQ